MNLLPADRYLIQALREAGVDLSDSEYCAFRAEVRSRVKIEPSKPKAGFDPVSALIYVVIGIGLQVAASFLKPQQRSGKSGRVNTKQVNGDDLVSNQRFAPRIGFDSFQEPASLGTTIPAIYARKQTLGSRTGPTRPAGNYGGVRINTPLIWSQMLSVGGSQMLRAMFMLGEACIESLDYNGFAVGNNSLGVYDLDPSIASSSGRLTFYFRPGGGRITSGDYVRGRSAGSDIGNATNFGGQDVYAVRGSADAWRQNFCFVSRPSTSTQFGVYSLIPNRLAVRINPRVRPTRTFQTKPGDDNVRVRNEDDAQALAEMWKSKYAWSGRAGIVSPGAEGAIVDVAVGSTFEYRLSRLTDAETEIVFNSTNTDNSVGDPDGKLKCGDIATIVSSRQRAADDALSIGEIYKAGSALCVLVSRTNPTTGAEVFISNSDNKPTGGGQNMVYTFRVVRAGKIGIIPADNLTQIARTGLKLYPPAGPNLTSADTGPRFKTATGFPQIYRCAIANVIAPRETLVVELGIKSTVGIQINGFCNFRDCPTMAVINNRAGDFYEGKTYGRSKGFNLSVFTSGTVTSNELRYSFFDVYYREEGGTYTRMNCSIGVRSMTAQPVYNYVRFSMPTLKRWEFKLEPISGWEVRNGSPSDPLLVLDYRNNGVQAMGVGGGVVVRWNGVVVPRSASTFSLGSLDPVQDIGLTWTEDQTMTDSWGRVAEAFVYQEIQTTALSGPEHEIVYINTFSANDNIPKYDSISIIGMNIRAATEWAQLGQLSAYVTGGRKVARLLGGFGASNLFPDILRDLMLNPVFGAGGLLSTDQIDLDSFVAAAQWCQDRRYFFDGALTEKTNLRQWAADTAATMLLDLVQRNGRFCLEPAVVFTGAVPIKALFTAGNIVEGTFKLEFLEEDEREPIQASVKWREERARDSYAGAGYFPVEREVLVREASRPDTDSIESFDLSDYCTNLEHAIDFACYVIRMRRLITHSIKFTTTPDGLIAGIAAGDYIKVAMDYAYYDEFSNGVVLPDGTLLSTNPGSLGAGTHDIVAWNGSADDAYDTTLTIDADGKATPVAIAFVKKVATTNVRVYKIESLSINQNGEIEIEAVHHPVDNAGLSLITKNWTTYATDSNWVIMR